MPDAALLELIDVSKRFPLGAGVFTRPTAWVQAVSGVSFKIGRGESFGLVGESGCGKTTVGRLVLRLIEPTGGRIRFDGREILMLEPNAFSRLRRRMQIIFQDPYSSLDPVCGWKRSSPNRSLPIENRPPEASAAAPPKPFSGRWGCAHPIWTNIRTSSRAASASASALRAPCASAPSSSSPTSRSAPWMCRFSPGHQPAPGPAGGVRSLLPLHLA
jgi:ABC-type oligopeptide transport system ATPase subunit